MAMNVFCPENSNLRLIILILIYFLNTHRAGVAGDDDDSERRSRLGMGTVQVVMYRHQQSVYRHQIRYTHSTHNTLIVTANRGDPVINLHHVHSDIE